MESETAGRKETSWIKNKLKRSQQTAKLRVEKKKAKKQRLKERRRREEEAEAEGEQAPPRPIPRTIESCRVYGDAEPLQKAEEKPLSTEAQNQEEDDEASGRPLPKILITSSPRPTKIMFQLIGELLEAIPGSQFYERKGYKVRQIVQFASNRDFTALIIINENQKTPNGLLLISLPDGPTAEFRMSNVVLSKRVKNHGRPSTHTPELILNNFTTNLGTRVAGLLGSLFPQDPQYKGRRVITFHNQRDFIFFRHHRYIFQGESSEDVTQNALEPKQSPPIKRAKEGNQKKASKGKGDEDISGAEPDVTTRLQECGPRFTLRLLSLREGAFNTKQTTLSDSDWIHNRKLEKNRRMFCL